MLCACALTIAFTFSGCFFQSAPYKEVKYYDLSEPPKLSCDKVFIKFMLFKLTEPVKYKMVYNDKDCRVLVDDYNKWIQPPGFMLTRYLENAFSATKTSKATKVEYLISGTIFKFRINLKSMQASLGASYKIKKEAQGKDQLLTMNSITFTAPIKVESPSGFAEAMSNCASQFARELAHQVKLLQKQNKIKNTKAK
jgi:uncharacterized lipoprotein YmbA